MYALLDTMHKTSGILGRVISAHHKISAAIKSDKRVQPPKPLFLPIRLVKFDSVYVRECRAGALFGESYAMPLSEIENHEWASYAE